LRIFLPWKFDLLNFSLDSLGRTGDSRGEKLEILKNSIGFRSGVLEEFMPLL